RHPQFGDVLTTAGHAIPPGQGAQPLTIESGGSGFQAQVVSVTLNQTSDHALLRPQQPGLLGNLFRGITPLGPPYIPDPETDTNAQLYVLLASGAVAPVRCRGLTASIQTAPNVVMHDLILTDRRTVGGDSGTCLVDSSWRVWGLLLGAFQG